MFHTFFANQPSQNCFWLLQPWFSKRFITIMCSSSTSFLYKYQFDGALTILALEHNGKNLQICDFIYFFKCSFITDPNLWVLLWRHVLKKVPKFYSTGSAHIRSACRTWQIKSWRNVFSRQQELNDKLFGCTTENFAASFWINAAFKWANLN